MGPLPTAPQRSHTSSVGVATFDNLKVDKVASGYQFHAAFVAPAVGAEATSDPFNVVDDLKVCSGNPPPTSCSSTVTAPNNQKVDTALSSQTGLSGELLTSSLFSIDQLSAPDGACPGFTPIPGSVGTEVEVQGGNPTQTQPSFTITLRVPGNLLQFGPAWTHDVCLGATSFDSSATPWLTKTLDTSSVPWKRKAAVPDAGRYWGIVPSCAFAGGDPLPWLPIPTNNPCIVSKQRTGFLGLTGDLVIVLKKPYPWDGRWGSD